MEFDYISSSTVKWGEDKSFLTFLVCFWFMFPFNEVFIWKICVVTGTTLHNYYFYKHVDAAKEAKMRVFIFTLNMGGTWTE